MRFTPMEKRKVAVGVDLGQSRDPTTIAALERVHWIVPEHITRDLMERGERARLVDMKKELPRDEFNLRILEPAPLGEPYPMQAERLKGVLRRPALLAMDNTPAVWMDATGVGVAVYDIFRQAQVPNLHRVSITSGEGAGRPNGMGGHSVPKLALVSRLQALMHTGALHVPEAMPYAKTFRRELMDFRVSYTARGNPTFNALEGRHDDTITAVALAIYGLDGGREVQVMPLSWAMEGLSWEHVS